jgi:hypothetical protein
VFVDAGDDSYATLRLTCLASNEPQAEEIEERLSCFLEKPTLCLIPPWAGDDLDVRSEDERLRHETARAMFCKLERTRVPEAPELESLDEKMNRAARRNDQSEHQRLSEQHSRLHNKLLIRELERIRDGETDPIARDLADRYISIRLDEQQRAETEEAADEPENEEEWDDFQYQAHARQRNELGPLMGRLQLSPHDDRPTRRTLRYSPDYGYAYRSGSVKLAVCVCFEDVSHGAPALVKWLDQCGCREFKYEFTHNSVSDQYYDE